MSNLKPALVQHSIDLCLYAIITNASCKMEDKHLLEARPVWSYTLKGWAPYQCPPSLLIPGPHYRWAKGCNTRESGSLCRRSCPGCRSSQIWLLLCGWLANHPKSARITQNIAAQHNYGRTAVLSLPVFCPYGL